MTIDTETMQLQSERSRKLIRYGILLFLLGLITGFLIPALQNPRMGLSSHLEGLLNGMFLVILGLIWTRLNLSRRSFFWTYVLALFGTFTNWATTLMAGIWGAGSEMMPFAGNGHEAALWQEVVIKIGLFSLSIAITIACFMVFIGLREKREKDEDG